MSLVALSISEIIGDFSFKNFARTGNNMEFIKGSAGYIAVVYFLIQSLKSGNVMYVNGMWDGMSALFESIAAYLILGERLKTPTQYIGLILVIVGIYILKRGGVPY